MGNAVAESVCLTEIFNLFHTALSFVTLVNKISVTILCMYTWIWKEGMMEHLWLISTTNLKGMICNDTRHPHQ